MDLSPVTDVSPDGGSQSESAGLDIVSMAAPPPAAEEEPARDNRYFNRELSWLAFNERVLAEASNTEYPLLERLRFLSISGSNLDEFMMIRVAGLAGQARREIDTRSIDGKTPTQQLTEINRKVRRLERWQQRVLEELREKLAPEGIRIADANAVHGEAGQWLRQFFIDDVLPVLTPQAIDPAHPFPFIANLGMGMLFNLTRRADGARLVEMVLVPPAMPRFVRVPGAEATYVPIEGVIGRFARLIFPGFRIDGDGSYGEVDPSYYYRWKLALDSMNRADSTRRADSLRIDSTLHPKSPQRQQQAGIGGGGAMVSKVGR